MKKVHRLIILLCLVSLLPTLNYSINRKNENIKKQKERVLLENVEYWKKIVSETPTYRDAYVQLAIGYWQLGAMPQAQEFLQQAQLLDPYWVPPPELAPLLP